MYNTKNTALDEGARRVRLTAVVVGGYMRTDLKQRVLVLDEYAIEVCANKDGKEVPLTLTEWDVFQNPTFGLVLPPYEMGQKPLSLGSVVEARLMPADEGEMWLVFDNKCCTEHGYRLRVDKSATGGGIRNFATAQTELDGDLFGDPNGKYVEDVERRKELLAKYADTFCTNQFGSLPVVLCVSYAEPKDGEDPVIAIDTGFEMNLAGAINESGKYSPKAIMREWLTPIFGVQRHV